MPRTCLLVALLIVLPLGAADPPPDQKQIAEWIKDLSARQFARRNRAQQKLWEAGAAAEPALREAAKSTDAEVQRRANEILAKFKSGIYPNTSKPIVALIEKYQSTEEEKRGGVLVDLLDHGAAGLATLSRLIEAEETPKTRSDLYAQVAYQAGRALPSLTVEKNLAPLEQLLERCLDGVERRDAVLPHYTAFHLYQGSLDKRIAHFSKSELDREKAGEALFFLHRAKSDVKAARAAAEKARRLDLLVGLLEERGDWHELAVSDLAVTQREPVEKLGYRAAYLRLAGKHKEAQEAVAALKKNAEEHEAGSYERWAAIKSMLLNDATEDALALMTRGEDSLRKLDILVAQMRYTEALAFAEKPPDESNKEPFAVIRARTLHFLGHKDEALKLFTALGDKLKPGLEYFWLESLIDAELRSGLKELAFTHCARALSVADANGYGHMPLLKKLFPDEEMTANVWWTVLRRKQASEDVTVSMKSLRQLMTGSIKGKELTALIGDLEARTNEPMSGATAIAIGRWLQAAAEIALKAGDETTAQAYFEKASRESKSAGPLLKWSDHLAEQKKWNEAAASYRAAWLKEPLDPLALFLHGDALVKAGKKTEGDAACELAHWLPLGDETIRLEFARQLAMRGQHEASRKTRAIHLKVGQPNSFSAGEVQRLDGIDALKARDYRAASVRHEVAMLRCQGKHIGFTMGQAYITMPYYLHRLRARGLAQAGRLDEAMKEAAVCEALLPGGIDVAIHLVPELEKRGRKQEAEEMYRKNRAAQRKLVKDQPASAAMHNSLAWLLASLRRDLNEARTHAEKAVELEPTLPGYRDTLAEVLFQLGKKNEAIGHIKKCLELEPKREYYKQQLKRFEAGDPKAEIPLEE